MTLDVVVLAAGSASRFGGCKLLADWLGQPLISVSLSAARALKPEKLVVVAGAFYSQLKEAQLQLDDGELLEFSNWQSGMGHSLAFGVSQLPSDNSVLILLGDQPLVSAQDLQHLYSAWSAQPTKIACSIFSNSLGVPAIFPARFKNELRACTGDRGAKMLLTRYSDELIRVPMPTAEYDVDTPSDLERLLLKNIAR